MTWTMILCLGFLGCGGFASSPDKTANSYLTQRLDEWIAGSPGDGIVPPRLVLHKLLGYDVKTLVARGEDWFLANVDKGDPVFLATVNLSIEGQGETQVRYRIGIKKATNECTLRWLPD
jgi:hypothetical protein